MSMDFVPALDGVSDHCAICHKKVQLWNIGGGPSANGMLILDPETQRSHAYHFDCAAQEGRRWVTVHLGYFMPEKEPSSGRIKETSGGAPGEPRPTRL